MTPRKAPVQITLRFTPEQRQRLRELADVWELTMNATVARAVQDALAKIKFTGLYETWRREHTARELREIQESKAEQMTAMTLAQASRAALLVMNLEGQPAPKKRNECR